jgi:transcriptional regulator with XRE-family HTH domain
MSTKSINALAERLAKLPEGQAEHLAVAYLLQVNLRMHDLNMSNAELAQRLGTTPAYVTRLFSGSVNMSVQTMVKLAQAVYGSVKLEFMEDDNPA